MLCVLLYSRREKWLGLFLIHSVRVSWKNICWCWCLLFKKVPTCPTFCVGAGYLSRDQRCIEELIIFPMCMMDCAGCVCVRVSFGWTVLSLSCVLGSAKLLRLRAVCFRASERISERRGRIWTDGQTDRRTEGGRETPWIPLSVRNEPQHGFELFANNGKKWTVKLAWLVMFFGGFFPPPRRHLNK